MTLPPSRPSLFRLSAATRAASLWREIWLAGNTKRSQIGLEPTAIWRMSVYVPELWDLGGWRAFINLFMSVTKNPPLGCVSRAGGAQGEHESACKLTYRHDTLCGGSHRFRSVRPTRTTGYT